MSKDELDLEPGDWVTFAPLRWLAEYGQSHLADKIGIIQDISYSDGEPWLHIYVPALHNPHNDGMVGIDPTGVRKTNEDQLPLEGLEVNATPIRFSDEERKAIATSVNRMRELRQHIENSAIPEKG